MTPLDFGIARRHQRMLGLALSLLLLGSSPMMGALGPSAQADSLFAGIRNIDVREVPQQGGKRHLIRFEADMQFQYQLQVVNDDQILLTIINARLSESLTRGGANGLLNIPGGGAVQSISLMPSENPAQEILAFNGPGLGRQDIVVEGAVRVNAKRAAEGPTLRLLPATPQAPQKLERIEIADQSIAPALRDSIGSLEADELPPALESAPEVLMTQATRPSITATAPNATPVKERTKPSQKPTKKPQQKPQDVGFLATWRAPATEHLTPKPKVEFPKGYIPPAATTIPSSLAEKPGEAPSESSPSRIKLPEPTTSTSVAESGLTPASLQPTVSAPVVRLTPKPAAMSIQSQREVSTDRQAEPPSGPRIVAISGSAQPHSRYESAAPNAPPAQAGAIRLGSSAPINASQQTPVEQSEEAEEAPAYGALSYSETTKQSTSRLMSSALGKYRKGDTQGALQEIHEAIELDQNHADLHAALAELQLSLKNDAAALPAYAKAATLSPGKYQVRYAELLIRNNRPVAARAALTSYLKGPGQQRPRTDRAKAHYMLGTLYEQAGETSFALEHLHQAAELDPRSADVQYNLGLAYELQGKLALAQSHYRKAVELNPSAEDAQQALRRVKI